MMKDKEQNAGAPCVSETPSEDKAPRVNAVPNEAENPHATTSLRAAEAATSRSSAAEWFVRIAYLAVFIMNVMCALQFIIAPEAYVGAYELAASGEAGAAAVQGIGVAFLMWNCTYPAVIVSPRRFRALAVVVLVQQTVGLVGESLILHQLGANNAVLASSIIRFIMFDAGGLVLMGIAFTVFCLASRR